MLSSAVTLPDTGEVLAIAYGATVADKAAGTGDPKTLNSNADPNPNPKL